MFREEDEREALEELRRRRKSNYLRFGIVVGSCLGTVAVVYSNEPIWGLAGQVFGILIAFAIAALRKEEF